MRRKAKSKTRSALIQAFGLFWRADEINWSPGIHNINRMKFVAAREWKQIKKDEWPKYKARL